MASHKRIRRRFWTKQEDARLRQLYPRRKTQEIAQLLGKSICSVFYRAGRLKLRKTAKYMASPEACRLRRGDHPGIAFQFKSGHVPANKGLRRPGWSPGRMAETQFKKGNHPHTWKPMGTTRVTKDGYLERKASDTGRPRRDWIGEHVLLWRKAHGRIRPGHAVVFQDGNKRNIVLRNLECITRRELLRRNKIHHYPPELKETILLVGKLRRAIEKKEQSHGQKQAV